MTGAADTRIWRAPPVIGSETQRKFPGRPIIPHDHDHRRGLLLALAAFAVLACGDATIKSIAGAWSPLASGALRYTFGAVGLGVILYRREGLSGFRTSRLRLHGLRGLGMAGTSLTYFSAIFLMPLADAAAIAFVGPAFTVLLSAAVVGEPVRRATWVAIALAFLGVVIVLQPNVTAFGLFALLPLASAACNSLYMVGNRLTMGDGSILAQQFYLAIIAAPLMIVAAVVGHFSGAPMLVVGLPAWHVVARCAIVAVTASASHWVLFRATMLAGPAAIAPMAYVQILVATAIGWAIFGNPPTLHSLVGIAVIIGSGLYLWRSGRAPAPEPLD